MTTAVSEPLTPAARAILDALQAHGPMSRAQLAEATAQPLGSVGTRLAILSEAGLIRVGAEMVSLPHQRAEDWRPDAEREHEHRRALWQRQGLLTLALHEVDDAYLAQQLRALAIQLYGQRRRGR